MSESSSLPPAGWYASPFPGADLAFWNGSGWTTHRLPLGRWARLRRATLRAFSRRTRGVLLGLLSVGLLVSVVMQGWDWPGTPVLLSVGYALAAATPSVVLLDRFFRVVLGSVLVIGVQQGAGWLPAAGMVAMFGLMFSTELVKGRISRTAYLWLTGVLTVAGATYLAYFLAFHG